MKNVCIDYQTIYNVLNERIKKTNECNSKYFITKMVNCLNKIQELNGNNELRVYSLDNTDDLVDAIHKSIKAIDIHDMISKCQEYNLMSYFDLCNNEVYQYDFSSIKLYIQDNLKDIVINMLERPYEKEFGELWEAFVTPLIKEQL